MRHEVKRACICFRHPGTGVCDHHFHRNATRCSEASNSLTRFLNFKTRLSLNLKASALVASACGATSSNWSI
jgi:hypothetical protein